MRLSALLSLLFFILSPCKGTVVIPPDFAELVSQADTILDATVTHVRSVKEKQEGGSVIVTHVSLSIHEVLKGTPKSPYTLEILGGTVGNETLTVDGAPQFQKGDRALFFIEGNGKTAVPLVGIMYGIYWVENDPSTGEESLLKSTGLPLMSTSEIDAIAAKGPHHHTEGPTSKAATRPPRSQSGAVSLKEFKQEITTRLKAAKP